MEFHKLTHFSVDRPSPHIVVDPSGLWISYLDFATEDEGKNLISLFDLDGNKLKSVDIDDAVVRRMATDGKGTLYMCCLESQSVKSFDTINEEVETVMEFEGYPAGIDFRHEDNSLVICENQGPSYFVYEGHHYSRLSKVSLPDLETNLLSDDKCHAFINNVAVGRDGVMWTADYINDAVYCLSPDGARTNVFPKADDETCVMPVDICCDEDGHVFVICTASKCLYVLGTDCTVVGKLDFDFGIPSSVAVKNKTIWIGNMDNSDVHVYKYTVKT